MIHLNHIGIAVANLPELQDLFQLLGLSVNHSEGVPEQGVRTHFLPITFDPKGTSLELLEVLDPEGTVAKFLQKKGPGIHHLSFRVEKGQLDVLCAKLHEHGRRLIYPHARPGAHGMRVNFIHPGSAGGILVELMEVS